MTVQQLLVAAFTGVSPELEENTRDHLTTREMYAVNTNRSFGKSLRRGIASLLSVIKTH